MQKMTSRERVIRAIQHQEPDRVPLDLTITVDAYKKLKQYLGIDIDEELHPSVWTTVVVNPVVMDRLGLDIAYLVADEPEGYPKLRPDGKLVDMWGVIRKKISVGDSYYYEVTDPPLKDATVADLEDYPWPKFKDQAIIEQLRKEIKWWKSNTDKAIEVQLERASLIELPAFMRGLQQWWIDLVSNPEFAHALMDKLLGFAMEMDRIGIEALGEDIDILRVDGDDLGTQNGPIFSPNTYNTFIRPRQAKLWGQAKALLQQKNPNAKIMYHSCGGIRPFIPTLIESGVDILNPVQPKAKGMETSGLKRDFGDRLSFHGAIDIQEVLPFGNQEEVVAEVRTRINQLGVGGGYILAPAHNLQADVPPANLITMYEAAKEYGKYPIKK